jgi:peptidoglycan/LPS O-acetylase OafA/YrhL
MKHRREIDGLRAFAILPVLFFHAGFSWFQGGFFGVDVFFVISGFLITGIIVNELHTRNSFSIVNFYERRARRIMPALFLVIGVSLPLAWFLLFPDEFKTFLKSLVSITYFGSNYFFLGQTGYFDPNIDLNPMLHTWSLAIEEQFYVFFPLILWVLWKFVKERYWIPILALFGIASLIAAQNNWFIDSSSTFYLLQFRAWELIAGAIAAIFLSHRKQPVYSKQLPSLLGIAMVVYSMFFIGSDLPHPGFITLVPIIGTVLIILFAGPGTIANKILSLKFFVGIGLISYSAYLWHQPLFAFYRVAQTHEASPWEFIPIMLLVIALSGLSWKYVENPFRNRKRFGRKSIFAGTAVLAIGLLGITFVASRASLSFARGQSSASLLQALEDRLATNTGLSGKCRIFVGDDPRCSTGGNPEVLLWGDSYAMHLADALKASPTTLAFSQQTLSACAPVLGLAHQNASYGIDEGEECIKHNDDVFAWLKSNANIKYVIMASPWADALWPDGESLNRQGIVVPNGNSSLQALRTTVARVEALGKKVVLVQPTPNNGNNLGQCLIRAAARDQDLKKCDFNLGENVRLQINEILQLASNVAPVFSLDALICPQGTCRASVDGIFIYRDTAHLSHEGSTYLGATYDLMGQLIRRADLGY